MDTEKFTEKSCSAFVAALAAKTPVPGGGGASALCAAIGAALGSMVANYTVGKKKYAAVETDIIEYRARCEALRLDLLALVEEDAAAFAPLAAAYALPHSTEEEQKHKDAVTERALAEAAKAPLLIMEKACEAIALMDSLAEKGSRIVISDAGVGAALCRAALEGAALNVLINTKSMKDRTAADTLSARADGLLAQGTAAADAVYGRVLAHLR